MTTVFNTFYILKQYLNILELYMKRVEKENKS